MSWWRDSGDGSSATCPHHGPAGADPGSNAMYLRLGLFQSIRPTIKYQPRKANVVANALSRSQHKLEEGSTDDVATAIAMIERHVWTLSGASVELTTEDLQQWTKAYKEDKGHVAAFMKLRQGQKYEDFYLTPSGLMARMLGGRQKIIVPKSLRQQILKECQDVPFTGTCGHAQDFGTSG